MVKGSSLPLRGHHSGENAVVVVILRNHVLGNLAQFLPTHTRIHSQGLSCHHHRSKFSLPVSFVAAYLTTGSREEMSRHARETCCFFHRVTMDGRPMPPLVLGSYIQESWVSTQCQSNPLLQEAGGLCLKGC